MPSPFSLSFVADHYRRYPGEKVTLVMRLDVQDTAPGFRLRLSMPEALSPGETRASENYGDRLPDLLLVGERRYTMWTVEREVRAGERYEFELEAVTAPTGRDLTVECVADARSLAEGDATPAIEAIEIKVPAKSRYLHYLPAIYYDDELMGRYLMLFESFWEPIEQQIEARHHYFDPKITPVDFLPWLATWVDLTLDERWPEDRRRKLLGAATALYRKRGTRAGLIDHLEIYTGTRARIIEHRSSNFQLGSSAKLGAGIALGRSNFPHTFTVILHLPPAENERAAQERQRVIESIIEANRPAHTAYTLQIEEAA